MHSLYGVVIDSTAIGGITAQSINVSTEAPAEPTSGETLPRFLSITAQNPRATFTTKALVSLLNALAAKAPTEGPGYSYYCDIDDLSAGLLFYGQAFADGSTRAGASSHRKLAIADGILGARRLSCTYQQDATIDVEAVVGYDGVNDPVIETDSESLPAGITDAERFTLGPITLENVTIPSVNSLDIDFGLNIKAEGAGSDIWPTHVSIIEIKPIITIKGIDIEVLKSTNIPRAGKAITHAHTTIYLRKRADRSTLVADETEEHIKFTAAGLAYVDTPMDARMSDKAEYTLIMPCYYDGTNDPIVIDTAAAIA